MSYGPLSLLPCENLDKDISKRCVGGWWLDLVKFMVIFLPFSCGQIMLVGLCIQDLSCGVCQVVEKIWKWIYVLESLHKLQSLYTFFNQSLQQIPNLFSFDYQFWTITEAVCIISSTHTLILIFPRKPVVKNNCVPHFPSFSQLNFLFW